MVHVRPGAGEERLEYGQDGALEAWVRAPALDGRANRALMSLLADRLALKRREIVIVNGERSRHKIVDLPIADSVMLLSRLDGGNPKRTAAAP